MEERKITLESTLKSEDTEELIDIYFYRPIGYRFALLFKRLGVTPNTVTIASIFVGIAAALFFYPAKLSLNIIGMLLLMFANTLDSTDGQLARMTNSKSRLGRLLDGLAGSFWFAAIEVVLALRLMHSGFPVTIWILAVAAGFSHILQSQQADYYRNIHLYFIKGKNGSESDYSDELNREFKALSWTRNFGKKLEVGFYRNYTRQQELLSPQLQKFMGVIRSRYGNDDLPGWLISDFRTLNKPLMKYTNIIQFNTRTIVLFISLFLNEVWIFFCFELLVLNAIMIYMVIRQEKVSAHFYKKLTSLQYA
jgi:hypothetical protein